MTSPLVQLAYISAARTPFSPTALRELLDGARANNRRRGVTGILLHADGSFLQVLEGPGDEVDKLYALISRDPRHERMVRIFRGELAAPTFIDWSMGFVEAEGAVRTGLLGFNRFLQVGGSSSLGTEREGTAAHSVRELMLQFRRGSWRQEVDTGSSRSSLAPGP
jgi:hypothetical protein